MSERADNNLPSGWAKATLGDVTQPSRPRVSPREHAGEPFIGMEHVQAHTMQILGSVDASTMKSSGVRFLAGDVLYGRLRPYLNKVVQPEHDGVCSAEFIVLPRCELFDNRFLRYRLNAWDFVAFATHLNEGDRPRVDFGQIEDYPLRIPPLNEQTRIVEAIEEQFTRLDSGVAALKRVEANLKRYKVAVLKAACEGKLTKKWREENPKVEPASELLKRILKERRSKWEEAELNKMIVKGKPPKNDRWKEKYTEPVPPDSRTLPRLPNSWHWVTAEQVCEDYITKGTTPKSSAMSSQNIGIPFIKVYNLTHDGQLDFSVNPTFISTETHRSGPLQRSRTLPGDVLMNLVGPPLGKVSVVPDSCPEWNVNQAIAILRPLSGLGNRFLAGCLLTEQILAWAIRQSRATAGQRNITLDLTRHLPLPLPPACEQLQIQQEVDSYVSIIEKGLDITLVNQRKSSLLRQSILKRAFEGKLVEQDPSDEPASKLLEQIKAEREKDSAKTNSKPKRGKQAAARKTRRRTKTKATVNQPELFS